MVQFQMKPSRQLLDVRCGQRLIMNLLSRCNDESFANYYSARITRCVAQSLSPRARMHFCPVHAPEKYKIYSPVSFSPPTKLTSNSLWLERRRSESCHVVETQRRSDLVHGSNSSPSNRTVGIRNYEMLLDRLGSSRASLERFR